MKVVVIFSVGLLAYGLFSDPVLGNEKKTINVNNSIEEAISKASTSDDQWFVYEVDMEPGNGSPCCYQRGDQMGCSLDIKNNNVGFRHSELNLDSDTLKIYFRWKNKMPERLFYTGDSCPVETGSNSLITLNQISKQESLDFLNSIINNKKGKNNHQTTTSALASIALQAGDEAHEKLESFSSSDEREIRQHAIFWLGNARNKAGYHSLVKILDDRTRLIKDRTKAVFALSQNSYAESVDKLIDLAQKDKNIKIQSEALFWLANQHGEKALDVIKPIVESEQSEELLKKAIFSLSQIDSDKAWQLLVSYAKNHSSTVVQKQSIFWLSQNNNRSALSTLVDIAEGNKPQKIRESAVFSISQLNSKNATQGLIQLLKNNNDRFIKRKAIFWLGQSNDPEALTYLESALISASDN